MFSNQEKTGIKYFCVIFFFFITFLTSHIFKDLKYLKYVHTVKYITKKYFIFLSLPIVYNLKIDKPAKMNCRDAMFFNLKCKNIFKKFNTYQIMK